MRNGQNMPQHGSKRVIVSITAVLLAALLPGGEVPSVGGTRSFRTHKDMSVGECRVRVLADAKALLENRRIASKEAVLPTEEVLAVMTPSERKSVVDGVGHIYERVISTNRCEGVELEWGVRALSCLCQDVDEDTAPVINRIFESPVHRVMTLEKIAQLETMMRTVYQKTVTGVDVSPNEFDRTEYKKALIRRRLSLMRGHAQ